MSANGNRVAIGAPRNLNIGAQSGHVRVWEWNGASWSQLGADINGSATGDFSGYSVALSNDGNRVAVGAPGGINAGKRGHVRVWEWNGVSWSQLGADINGESTGDESGRSISMSADGNRIAIGAPRNRGTGVLLGHVRVWGWNGASWSQLGADIDGEGFSESGTLVALSADGNRVASGSPYKDNFRGQARVWEWNGESWNQLGADINPEGGADRIGHSVALSADGNRVAVGAHANNSSTGHVRVMQWNGASWSQLGADIDGEDFRDKSGWSVSMSADGERVAIGAPYNDGGGENAGHVRVYDWSGSAWVQFGADINGVRGQAEEFSGWSVALSPNGNRVAIGSPFFPANGARVFDIFTGTVGGIVRGLQDISVVLQNNGADDLVINDNGFFTFTTPLDNGSDYDVTVLPPPTCPSATCSISNGSGTLAGENVTNVIIELGDEVLGDGFEDSAIPD